MRILDDYISAQFDNEKNEDRKYKKVVNSYLKIAKLLELHEGKIMLSEGAPGCLVIKCRSFIMTAKNMDVVCGDEFLAEGGVINASALAASESSRGYMLPCGENEWRNIRVLNSSRHHLENDLNELLWSFNADDEGSCLDIGQAFDEGEYEMSGAASLNAIKDHVTSSANGKERGIFELDGKFCDISLSLLRGLSLLGASVYFRIIPEHDGPIINFVHQELGLVGRVIDSSSRRHLGSRQAPDGRSMSVGACYACWISPDDAIKQIYQNRSNTFYYDDVLLDVATIVSRGVGIADWISVLRWHMFSDEKIQQILNDAEDKGIYDLIRRNGIATSEATDVLEQTGRIPQAKKRYFDLNMEAQRIQKRIESRYGQLSQESLFSDHGNAPYEIVEIWQAANDALNVLRHNIDLVESDIPF